MLTDADRLRATAETLDGREDVWQPVAEILRAVADMKVKGCSWVSSSPASRIHDSAMMLVLLVGEE